MQSLSKLKLPLLAVALAVFGLGAAPLMAADKTEKTPAAEQSKPVHKHEAHSGDQAKLKAKHKGKPKAKPENKEEKQK